MRCKPKTHVIFLAVLILFFLVFHVEATEWQFPDDLTISIPDGMTWHFGDQWISTSGTDIHIETWFVSDWVTYTVDGSGTQEIYKDSKPSLVFVDEVEKSEADSWSYASGTTTITGATSKVSVFFGSASPPSTTPPVGPTLPDVSTKLVLFRVTVVNNPCVDCKIEVFELPYEDYKGVCFTDKNGSANMTLDYGEYKYEAEYQGMVKNDTFLHVEQQTVIIVFDRARLPVKLNVFMVIFALAVIVGAVLAINKVRKF